MYEQLEELLNIHSVSGDEGRVRSFLFPILRELMDVVMIDAKGNLLAEKQVGRGKGTTILFSAHLDTVTGTEKNKIVVEENNIFTAILPNGERTILGADDRAGIAIVLESLRSLPKSFNGTIKIAFTVEEETGRNGSNALDFNFYKDVDLAIVVDRKGDKDIVVGHKNAFCSNEVADFMQRASDSIGLDFECTVGGISDAVTFSKKGINTINLSAGYSNEHTARESLDFISMMKTVSFINHVLSVINKHHQGFGAVSKYNQWAKPFEFMEDDIIFDYDAFDNCF